MAVVQICVLIVFKEVVHFPVEVDPYDCSGETILPHVPVIVLKKTLILHLSQWSSLSLTGFQEQQSCNEITMF